MFMAISLIAPIYAVAADNTVKVNEANPSKLSGYMKGKSCVSASRTLASKGWMPYRNPNNMPAEVTEENRNKKLFNKYKELHSCAGTDLGFCEAHYTKGEFNLTVNYDAKGGSGFENKDCRAVSYLVNTTPFEEDVNAEEFDRQLIEYMNKNTK